MADKERDGFTILELLIVVIVSGIIAISVSLFLQRSTSTFRKTERESELVGRVKFALDRLRRCIRHAISPLANFRNTHAAFERTETLFFVTDFDQNGSREAHFVWYDRIDTANLGGTNRLLHVWQEPNQITATQPTFTSLAMPPDMTDVTAPSFANLLAYLRNPANFNGGGAPTVREGWEILVDAPYPRPTTAPAVPRGTLPIHLGRLTAFPGTPAWPVVNGQTVPPSGISFNIDNWLRVTPGNPATFSYPVINPPGANSMLNELCLLAGVPYARPAGGLGAPSVQCFLNVFLDENQTSSANYTTALADDDEPSVQFLTTFNMLLIPSAGSTTP